MHPPFQTVLSVAMLTGCCWGGAQAAVAADRRLMKGGREALEAVPEWAIIRSHLTPRWRPLDTHLHPMHVNDLLHPEWEHRS